MPAVTTLTLFTFKQNKFWAFKQMGIAAGKLKSVEGLQFFKFLGTGGGSGFSLTPDFSTYAFLGVWNDRSQYNDCMNEHPVFLQYKEKASSQRELVLRVLSVITLLIMTLASSINFIHGLDVLVIAWILFCLAVFITRT